MSRKEALKNIAAVRARCLRDMLLAVLGLSLLVVASYLDQRVSSLCVALGALGALMAFLDWWMIGAADELRDHLERTP